MFAYEIKVCMFRNASIFSGTGATQRKLFPESCAELNNIGYLSLRSCAAFPKILGQTALRAPVNTQLPVCTANSNRLA